MPFLIRFRTMLAAAANVEAITNNYSALVLQREASKWDAAHMQDTIFEAVQQRGVEVGFDDIDDTPENRQEIGQMVANNCHLYTNAFFLVVNVVVMIARSIVENAQIHSRKLARKDIRRTAVLEAVRNTFMAVFLGTLTDDAAERLVPLFRERLEGMVIQMQPDLRANTWKKLCQSRQSNQSQ